MKTAEDMKGTGSAELVHSGRWGAEDLLILIFNIYDKRYK